MTLPCSLFLMDQSHGEKQPGLHRHLVNLQRVFCGYKEQAGFRDVGGLSSSILQTLWYLWVSVKHCPSHRGTRMSIIVPSPQTSRDLPRNGGHQMKQIEIQDFYLNPVKFQVKGKWFFSVSIIILYRTIHFLLCPIRDVTYTKKICYLSEIQVWLNALYFTWQLCNQRHLSSPWVSGGLRVAHNFFHAWRLLRGML